MSNFQGNYAVDETVYVLFESVDALGASVTITGLAVTDIEIYKDGSVTQRSSDVGYTLLDTDGIDFDATTGIHGFSIDLSDNTDAGFFAAGSDYHVVVNSITLEGQTVAFIAAHFAIENRVSGGATAAAIADAVWDEVLTGLTHNITNSAGKKLRQAADVVAYSGTVNDAVAAADSFIIDASASSVDDFYVDQTFIFTDGALDGQARVVLTYTGATRTVTFDEPFTSAPVNGVGIQITADHVHPIHQIAAAILGGTGVAMSNLEVLMVDSTTKDPKTSLTVTGEKSIDGGAFAAVTGTIAEVGSGIYQFDASAADMNGTIITFKFSSAGADVTFITVKTAG